MKRMDPSRITKRLHVERRPDASENAILVMNGTEAFVFAIFQQVMDYVGVTRCDKIFGEPSTRPKSLYTKELQKEGHMTGLKGHYSIDIECLMCAHWNAGCQCQWLESAKEASTAGDEVYIRREPQGYLEGLITLEICYCLYKQEQLKCLRYDRYDWGANTTKGLNANRTRVCRTSVEGSIPFFAWTFKLNVRED